MSTISLLQVARRQSISAITVLLTFWPANIMSGAEENSTTTDKPSNWIEMEIPLYYTIGVGGLLLVTFISCMLCLCYSRRRKGKEYFIDEAKKDQRPDNTWEMRVALPANELVETDEKDSKETADDKANADSLSQVRVIVQSNNKNDEEKSNEATEEEEENLDGYDQQQHQDQSDVKCAGDVIEIEEGNGTGILGTDLTEAQEDTDISPGSKQEINMINGKTEESASVEGFLHANSGVKPRAEPVYAEVNKPQKTKKNQTSGYNIVYAELADFGQQKNGASSPRGNPSPVEYAEIARLTKSPRDMCPLDDY